MISVSGLTQPVPAEAFDGSSRWTGYDTISGHWFRRDGEVDVNTAFLNQTGLSVGDLVHLTVGGQAVTARIAGQVFDPYGRDQPTLLASWQTLGGAAAGLAVTQYDIGLKPGVSAMAYASALGQSLPAQSPIGLRRAQGATRVHIGGQLLLEALLLSALGGAFGVAVGVVVTFGISRFRGWSAQVPLLTVWGGLGTAVTVGAIAGLYPALNAARLSPADALRSA